MQKTAKKIDGKYTAPVSTSRPGWRRRIEVFSPKLHRRLSHSSYLAYRTWLVIEANPAIEIFCERPAYLGATGTQLIDFWVKLRGKPLGEFWMIEQQSTNSLINSEIPPSAHGLPIRKILQSNLAAWSQAITNWGRIVPFLVSHSRWRNPVLEQSLVVYLGVSNTLDKTLMQFADHDLSAVEAALYMLLASGRINCPDLVSAPVTGATRFVRA